MAPTRPYPFADARRLRDEAKKKLLASGVDPGANKKVEKLTAVISATNTFGGIAEEYLERIEDEAPPRPPSRRTDGCLSTLPAPTLAPDQSPKSPRQKSSYCCNGSNAADAGRRLGGCAASLARLRLAVSTLRAKDDPTLLLRGALKAPKVQHRAAITDEASRCASGGHRCL